MVFRLEAGIHSSLRINDEKRIGGRGNDRKKKKKANAAVEHMYGTLPPTKNKKKGKKKDKKELSN